MDLHIQHLRVVLSLLLQHQLYAKRSKCVFGISEVEYLGHILSGPGVSVDPKKLSTMKDWPSPTIVKALHGFLGLTVYYRKFIHHYGQIVAPLTTFLKKKAFVWSLQAKEAFQNLKAKVCQPLVLALTDFSKPFTIECDASGVGLGVVLMQELLFPMRSQRVNLLREGEKRFA